MQLLGLPEEILDHVTSAAITSVEADDQYALLKLLRHVCKRFSRLDSVMKSLF